MSLTCGSLLGWQHLIVPSAGPSVSHNATALQAEPQGSGYLQQAGKPCPVAHGHDLWPGNPPARHQAFLHFGGPGLKGYNGADETDVVKMSVIASRVYRTLRQLPNGNQVTASRGIHLFAPFFFTEDLIIPSSIPGYASKSAPPSSAQAPSWLYLVAPRRSSSYMSRWFYPNIEPFAGQELSRLRSSLRIGHYLRESSSSAYHTPDHSAALYFLLRRRPSR